MKRKLDANDVPSTEAAEGDDSNDFSFENLDLDPRLRQALIKENYTKPTLVQAKAIPLALEGKDILGMYTVNSVSCMFLLDWVLTKSARAKTGSGKTAAYVLPILQTILQKKSVRSSRYSYRLLYHAI